MSSLLFGVAPTDAVTFVAAAPLLLLLAALASYLAGSPAAAVIRSSALRAE